MSGIVRVEGWAPDIQPGTVTVVTVEDREAAETAALAAAQSAVDAAASAAAAADSAEAAAASGGGGGNGTGFSSWTQVQQLPGYPGTFPPNSHSHPVTQISDATPVGRAVMTAADKQAARAAIGAGTGDGTSNLVLGSTASTAMPGNRAFSAAEVSFAPTATNPATNAQQAIVNAGLMGGSGGGGTTFPGIYAVVYANGAYPALPASPPAGVVARMFIGPVQYTGPDWTGVVNIYWVTKD